MNRNGQTSDERTEFLQTLHQEYARFQARFGAHLLGVVEKGASERIRTIQDCAKATAGLWAQFHLQYCRACHSEERSDEESPHTKKARLFFVARDSSADKSPL